MVKSVYFETNSAELGAESQQLLADLAAELRSQPDFDLDIEAFTDDEGGDGFNQKLAERRAISATDFLIKKEIQPRKTAIKSFGESRQKAADSPEETRRINRRVDILVTIYRFDDLAGLFERIDIGQKDAVFEFSGTGEKEFTTARGTKIWLPEDALEFENGEIPTKNISLKIREAYQPSDWFLNRLGTETEAGELLQTAGMVFTEASSEGRPLRLRTGREITMAVPSEGQPDPAMQLFAGKNHAEAGMDNQKWQAVPDGLIKNSLRRKAPRTVKLPKEVADFLKKMPFEVAEKPEKLKFSKKLVEPKPPIEPSKPHFTTKKPERADFVFQPNELKERLYSTEKRRKIEDKKFADASEFYEKGLATYQKRMKKYGAAVEKYRAESAEYSKKHDAWHADVKSRMAVWAAYSEKSYQAAIMKNLAAMLKNADKLAIPNNGKPLSENLLEMAETYIGKGKLDNTEPYKLGFAGIFLRKTDAPLDAMNVSLAKRQYSSDNGTAMDMIYREVLFEVLRDSTGKMPGLAKAPGFAAMEEVLQLKILEMGSKTGDLESMRAYVFRSSSLGWVNCDRFANLPPEDLMAIEVSETERAVLTIVLPKMKIAVNLTAFQDDLYRTAMRLPKGKKARLVSLKVQDGRALLAVHEFTIGKDAVPVLKYESMPLADLRKALERLNVSG